MSVAEEFCAWSGVGFIFVVWAEEYILKFKHCRFNF